MKKYRVRILILVLITSLFISAGCSGKKSSGYNTFSLGSNGSHLLTAMEAYNILASNKIVRSDDRLIEESTPNGEIENAIRTNHPDLVKKLKKYELKDGKSSIWVLILKEKDRKKFVIEINGTNATVFFEELPELHKVSTIDYKLVKIDSNIAVEYSNKCISKKYPKNNLLLTECTLKSDPDSDAMPVYRIGYMVDRNQNFIVGGTIRAVDGKQYSAVPYCIGTWVEKISEPIKG